MFKDRFRNTILLLSIVIVAFFIIVRDFCDIDVPSVIFAGVMFCLAVIQKKNDFACFVYFIFPIIVGVPGSYIMPLLAVLWCVKMPRLALKPMAFFLFLAVVEIFHFATYTFQSNILMIVRYLSCLYLMVAAITDNNYSSDAYVKRIHYFVLGCVFASICIIGNTITSNDGMILESVTRIGDFDGVVSDKIRLSMNPNSLAFLSVTSIAALLVLLHGNDKYRVRYVMMLVFCMIAGLLSLSRTWIIVMAMVMLLYVLSSNVRHKGAFFFVILVMTGFVLVIGESYLGALVQRFMESDLKTAGGRSEIFSQYNNYMFSSVYRLLFGTGATYYRDVTEVSLSIHNSLQQIFVSYGVVGIAVFIISFVSMLSRYRRLRFFAYLPILAVFFYMQTIQFLNPFFLMYPMVVAVDVLKVQLFEKV